jgi:hypothetical protein
VSRGRRFEPTARDALASAAVPVAPQGIGSGQIDRGLDLAVPLLHVARHPKSRAARAILSRWGMPAQPGSSLSLRFACHLPDGRIFSFGELDEKVRPEVKHKMISAADQKAFNADNKPHESSLYWISFFISLHRCRTLRSSRRSLGPIGRKETLSGAHKPIIP